MEKYGEPYTEPTVVYYHHKNLEYCMATKILNRRQAHWSQTLATIKFVISYRQGPAMESLTR